MGDTCNCMLYDGQPSKTRVTELLTKNQTRWRMCSRSTTLHLITILYQGRPSLSSIPTCAPHYTSATFEYPNTILLAGRFTQTNHPEESSPVRLALVTQSATSGKEDLLQVVPFSYKRFSDQRQLLYSPACVAYFEVAFILTFIKFIQAYYPPNNFLNAF